MVDYPNNPPQGAGGLPGTAAVPQNRAVPGAIYTSRPAPVSSSPSTPAGQSGVRTFGTMLANALNPSSAATTVRTPQNVATGMGPVYPNNPPGAGPGAASRQNLAPLTRYVGPDRDYYGGMVEASQRVGLSPTSGPIEDQRQWGSGYFSEGQYLGFRPPWEDQTLSPGPSGSGMFPRVSSMPIDLGTNPQSDPWSSNAFHRNPPFSIEDYTAEHPIIRPTYTRSGY